MKSYRFVKLSTLAVPFLAFAWCLPTTDSKTDEPARTASPAPDKMLGKEPGQVRDDNGLKMKLVWCPPGEFTMGCPEDTVGMAGACGGQVGVTLTKGYWLGQYEVKQSEWVAVMETKPWLGQGRTKDGDDFPAMRINWEGAMEFCRILTQQEREAGVLPDDWEYTLPTEAQWERACRGGTATIFSYGDDESKFGDYGWFIKNAYNVGERYAHEAGQKKPNPWGFFDMHGNLWEWCRDTYVKELPGGRDPEVKPDEKTKGRLRVLRGGCVESAPTGCRSAYRFNNYNLNQGYYAGFRVACSSIRQPAAADR